MKIGIFNCKEMQKIVVSTFFKMKIYRIMAKISMQWAMVF